MKEVTPKTNILEEENAELNESLVKALKTILKLRKSVSCLKIETRKMNEKSNSRSYVQSFKDHFFFVENEVCELEGKIEKFKTLKLSFLKKNMYSDIIRMTCEGILSMGLSTRNVEKVIIPLV